MLSRRLLLLPLQSRAFPASRPSLVHRAFASTSRVGNNKKSSSSEESKTRKDAITAPKPSRRRRHREKPAVPAEPAEPAPGELPYTPVLDKAKESKLKDDFSVEWAAERAAILAGRAPVEAGSAARSPPLEGKSLKEAMLGAEPAAGRRKRKTKSPEKLNINVLSPEDLQFQAVDVRVPPIPMLAYGLDRVLFNPGVYRLQDPRSRVYNFDPYLEKIISVEDFDFSALSEYKTSSKDEELLALTKRLNAKFTGSTSSMSGVLQHFHFLLSNFRPLNHDVLSRNFPEPSAKFSKITEGPGAIFLRWKDGTYAIDADKSYDLPNIMSWLGHSLEKLLTTDRKDFERYRRSNPEDPPSEDKAARCYHYSKLGNFLMRSQLDAHDPRLPGTGVFDLKTRAVVSIRMDHREYETGSGYQLRYDRGEWESFEREFYDMTRATMLKYSLQVRMGRMDGIFVAYHNIERIFGFQYLSLSDMDNALHGQVDPCLGDREFKLSIRLLDELLQVATRKFPKTTIHLHFHTQRGRGEDGPSFMYIFAEPVTEEQADEIQNKNLAAHRAFERDIVGVSRDDPDIQAEWQEIQDQVDEEVNGTILETRTEGSDEANIEDQEFPRRSFEDDEQESTDSPQTSTPELKASPNGPLMGWTLTLRHRVNGRYVDRPETLRPNDSWTVEYHIAEMNQDDAWPQYEKVKLKRKKLIGEEVDRMESVMGLDRYRMMIRRISDRGRAWRQEQDAIAARMEQRIYQPLGPGSHAQAEGTA